MENDPLTVVQLNQAEAIFFLGAQDDPETVVTDAPAVAYPSTTFSYQSELSLGRTSGSLTCTTGRSGSDPG